MGQISKKRYMDTVSINDFVNEHQMDLFLHMSQSIVSPFSYEFDGDNQIAKFDIIACGIWNTKSSHVHFQSN